MSLNQFDRLAFLEGGGEWAIITPIDKVKESIEGTAGTRIVP